MRTDRSLLERAISLVDRERANLCEERRAIEMFRETVRLMTPDSVDATGPSETSERLLSSYQEEVMDPLDHESVYGDTLAESLEQELSPSIADLLLSKNPVTQRHKRDLLLSVTATIESRDQFQAELEDERAALETFTEEIADTEATVDRLPPCSPRNQPLEKVLVIWDVYDTLAAQSEQLLQRRQQQIQDAERPERFFGIKHARNDYLYRELDTRYPVLTAIASTTERIESKRNGEEPSESPDGALQC